MLKLLQGRKMRTRELADYFEVDERTIRNDVQALRDGWEVLGVKIKVESKHSGDQLHHYISTVHPIFLALNSSELYALLKLLEEAMRKPRGDIYKHIFHQVYSQMTDYAEGLVAGKLIGKYQKTEISNLLEEEAIRKNPNIMLVYWEKSGRSINVTYRSKDGELISEDFYLVNIHGDNELIVRNEQGKQFSLNYDDVVVDWTSVDYK
ncbi:MAG: HTH domain-containing protein [Limnochordia bacterium]